MLRGISDIRAFFRTNSTPVFFVSPTAFNLLGIDRWLRTFFYVNYFDSFEVAHPPAELRHRLDSKIVTTRLGNEAGVPSAPNTPGRATSHDELRALAGSAGLGDDLVVQTPYGDSGKTTFFIRGQRDWDEYASDMTGQELEVMKRINNRAAAVEAVLTRHGTIVGPLMTDLTGHPELTPNKGGWCGNDVFPEALSPEHRERARVLTRKLGDRLAVEGNRGFLEIDYLADVDTGELYLGEINPSISGVTPMTHVTAGAYADAPRFLFHLLEYLDIDVWSQMILEDKVQFVGEPIDGAAEPVPTGALAFKTA